MNPHPVHPVRPDHADPYDGEGEEPGLSALYRQGATQTPAPDLDRRILDQARAAVRPWLGSRFWPWRWSTQAPQVPTGTRRWNWRQGWRGRWKRSHPWPSQQREGQGWDWRQLAIPLSSAAVILLALGLFLRALDEQGTLEVIPGVAPKLHDEYRDFSPPRDMAAEGVGVLREEKLPGGAAWSARPSPPSSTPGKQVEVKANALGENLRVPPPSPQALKEPGLQDQVPDQAGDQAKGDERLPANLTAESPESRGDSRFKAQIAAGMPPADPEGWLHYIRRLGSSGQRLEASHQLAAFRQSYPQHPVPEDLAPLLDGE